MGEISLSCMDWLMMDSFSPTFKWIVPWTSGSTSWSCEMECSHMGKNLSHIGKGGRKRESLNTGFVKYVGYQMSHKMNFQSKSFNRNGANDSCLLQLYTHSNCPSSPKKSYLVEHVHIWCLQNLISFLFLLYILRSFNIHAM